MQFKKWLNENVDNPPQPGKSSGAAKRLKPNAALIEKQLTISQLLNSVRDIPYYKEIIEDFDNKDDSWVVYKKVLEYANYLMKNPTTVSNLPPILVIDGKLDDGAHRISAINLIMNRLDPQNPFWHNLKLKTIFANQSDVLN